MAHERPPPYSIAASASVYGSISGFPLGYFMIRSLATGRVLDVDSNELVDGTEVVLWEEKEKSLVQGMRDRGADNQLFFIDETGALCSKHSGHAIDITDGMLVLRHRRPITHPYPNKYSHDLPRFSYDPVSGNISIAFTSDPSYPDRRPKAHEAREPPPTPPEVGLEYGQGAPQSHLAASFQITNGSSSSVELSVPEREPTRPAQPNSSAPDHGSGRAHLAPAPAPAPAPAVLQPSQPPPRIRATDPWKTRMHLLTALPARKPKTLLDDAAAFLASTASILAFPFSAAPAAPSSSSPSSPGAGDHTRSGVARQHTHIDSGEFDLRESEIVEEERAEAEEVDDDPDPARRVRIYGFRPRDLAEGAANTRARERRRWEIVPIRKERRRF